MSSLIHRVQYPLVAESMPSERRTERGDLEHRAVAAWTTTADRLESTTYYWNNVGVTAPFQLLNDSSNQPIWVVDAIFTFSDVGWRYAPEGEVITDYCGHHGQVDPTFTCPRANV